MYELVDSCRPFLLIGLGSILGSWLRICIQQYFQNALSRKYLGTVLVNISSAFFLGFFVAIQEKFGSDFVTIKSPIFFFLCVGFLGSLSTFSTFITDLMKTFLDKRLKLFFGLGIFSVSAGLLLALLGIALGNA